MTRNAESTAFFERSFDQNGTSLETSLNGGGDLRKKPLAHVREERDGQMSVKTYFDNVFSRQSPGPDGLAFRVPKLTSIGLL